MPNRKTHAQIAANARAPYVEAIKRVTQQRDELLTMLDRVACALQDSARQHAQEHITLTPEPVTIYRLELSCSALSMVDRIQHESPAHSNRTTRPEEPDRMSLSFKTSPEDFAIIEEIAARAAIMALAHGVKYSLMTAHMDITVCHANGCPLALAKLRDADDANFAHDVYGIRRHMDRKTGKLTGGFFPRFALANHEPQKTA